MAKAKVKRIVIGAAIDENDACIRAQMAFIANGIEPVEVVAIEWQKSLFGPDDAVVYVKVKKHG